MPRDGYINLTLRKSVRNRLARIARSESRTMTEQLEHMLFERERSLGIKIAKPSAQSAGAGSRASAARSLRKKRNGR